LENVYFLGPGSRWKDTSKMRMGCRVQLQDCVVNTSLLNKSLEIPLRIRPQVVAWSFRYRTLDILFCLSTGSGIQSASCPESSLGDLSSGVKRSGHEADGQFTSI
jgi:hypothetical protein